MTASQKVAHLAFVVLLLSLPAFGQYIGTPGASAVDGTANFCATTNCWTSTGIALTWVSASYDGLILGGNANDHYKVYWFNPATQKWVEQTALETANGHAITYIAVGGQSSYIIGLTGEANNNVYYTDMTHKSWLNIGGNVACQSPNVGVTRTDDLWCLTSNGTPEHYLGNGAWSSPGGTLTALSVAGRSATTFMYGINSQHQLFGWTGSTWHAATNLNFTPSSSPGSVSGSADGGFIAVLDTSNGIHISENAGSTWSTVTGTALSITAQNVVYTFTIYPSGQVNHYTGIMAGATQTTTGQSNCNAQCTANTTHQGSASASFPHGLNQGTSYEGVNPLNPMNVSHLDYSPSCDPVFTFGNPECNAALTSTATCPVMGQLLNVDMPENLQLITVYSKWHYVSTTGQHVILPLTQIQFNQYQVQSDCAAGYSTNLPLQYLWDTSPGPNWITATWLYGFVDPGSGNGYWFIIWTIGGQTWDSTPYQCQRAPGFNVTFDGTISNGPTLTPI